MIRGHSARSGVPPCGATPPLGRPIGGKVGRWRRPRETPSAGGADRVRTGDPLVANQVLSQLSYSPGARPVGGPKWIRTTDLTVISRAL